MTKKIQEKILKCLVIGDGGVGKTSLIIKYSTGNFPTFSPSCTPAYCVSVQLSSLYPADRSIQEIYIPSVYDGAYGPTPYTIDDTTIHLSIWDTGGGEDYDRLRPLSYPMTDVFIICFSVLDPRSFQNVRTKYAPEVAHHNPNTPVLVVGTKTDLRDNFSEDLNRTRPIYHHEALSLSEQLDGGSYLECSALTGSGVSSVFEQAMRLASDLLSAVNLTYQVTVARSSGEEVQESYRRIRRSLARGCVIV